jgi:hypothetical protein
MVAGAFVFARRFVYGASRNLAFQSIGNQNMVYAQTPVAPERKLAVIPP